VVLEFINCISITNRDLTPYQLFYDELKPVTAPYRPNLKAYKAIGSYCEVFILLKKRPKVYKVKAKTELRRFLTNLRSKNCLVYIPTRNTVTKTPFFKLYEFKISLFLEEVLKSIDIRPLNDTAVTEDSIGEGISLDLLEIDDDIGSLELVTLKVLEPSRPSKFITPRLFKPLESENRPSEPMLRPLEKLIKLINSSNLDEMQLDLIISFYYRVKAMIFQEETR